MTVRLAGLAGLAALALALVAAITPATALAATCPRTSVVDLEDEVMCPVCKVPLGLAQEAPQADRQRAFILQQVEQCKSKEAIKVALAAEFGDEVLAAPEGEGFDLAVYLVPAIALALALGTSATAVARWRRRRGPSPAGVATAPGTAGDASSTPTARGPTAEAAARLDRDLERYDL